MGCSRNRICLESCKVEEIWPLHPTFLSVPATSLVGPGATYNTAAAVPEAWMWLTWRALQDRRIQPRRSGESSNDSFFNHLGSQPNVNRILGKAAKLLLAKRIPHSGRKLTDATGRERTSQSRNYRNLLKWSLNPG